MFPENLSVHCPGPSYSRSYIKVSVLQISYAYTKISYICIKISYINKLMYILELAVYIIIVMYSNYLHTYQTYSFMF